eukprot:1982-Heterococcus_DN1.PRE.1
MHCDNEHSGRSALHLAAARGLTSNAKALLQLGAAVNDRGWSPVSPLHLACARPGGSSSSANTVKLLLAHKANVLCRSDNSRYSSCDLESDWQPLHFAAVSFSKDSSSSSMETIDALIAAGASLDSTTAAGATPLWLAVRCCTATTSSAAARVEALLQRGAEL